MLVKYPLSEILEGDTFFLIESDYEFLRCVLLQGRICWCTTKTPIPKLTLKRSDYVYVSMPERNSLGYWKGREIDAKSMFDSRGTAENFREWQFAVGKREQIENDILERVE